jgi:hypothetical protein
MEKKLPVYCLDTASAMLTLSAQSSHGEYDSHDKTDLLAPKFLIHSVRKLTNTTVRRGRHRWYATNTGVGSVRSAVAIVR